MRGVVFKGEREVALEEFPDPRPGPGQVVIAMRASGMCGSDLSPYRDPSPPGAPLIISGHEPCGVVAEVGPAVSEWQARPGQRVLIHHYWGCGACKHCRVGYFQMCARGSRTMGFSAHGGNAPYLLAPATALAPLPDELSFEEGAAIACGTGTAYAALKRLDVSGRDTLAIFGQGPVGLAATQLATVMGARVIAVDPSAERRALASDLGAEVVLDPEASQPVQAILDLTHGEGADATLDCTGHPEARANCARAARSWGRSCFVGEKGTATFDMTPEVIHKQLTMYGSWTFSTVLMAECAQFAVDRRIPLKHVFTESFTLDQAPEAFRRFESRTMGKGVFTIAG
ncbi:MAG: zinc-binding dehydrogenase [Chloroflexota bacterium]|nr:zinc-binding dehydrogenase [Chloroflexota bacterium]